MAATESKSLFCPLLSDETDVKRVLTKSEADSVFTFFKECSLFRWHDANNDCEDRANAICILLNEWKIPNYKGWVFNGYLLKKGTGSLTNGWKYHVAALLPVLELDEIIFYIIDPATSGVLITIQEWADKLTDQPLTYHLIKSGDYYIYPSKKIEKDNWHKRDKRNYGWTMQGLSGINGVSSVGKAQLIFKKGKIKNTEDRFKKLLRSNTAIFPLAT